MKFHRIDIAVKMFFFSAIFLLLIGAVSAQTYHFDNYSVKEGLAQSSVYCIKQDKNGFVWLGTASGLSRFDGNQFINYTTENGLAEGAVKAIFIDTLGTIWLGHTNGGISRVCSDKIEKVLSVSADITSFVMDNENALWVSSYGEGVIKITNPYTLDKDSIHFNQFKGQEGLSDIIFQITQTKNGSIYFVTDVGVKSYNNQKNSFNFYKVKGMPAYFQITYMFESANEDQWFGSYNGGLYHYQKEKEKLNIYDAVDGLASNWVSIINEDLNGNIWIGTWGGGITKISEKGLVTINNKNGLKDLHIRSIYEDREGNILFGTKQTGLLIYKGDQFVSYGVENGLVSEQVLSIIKNNNQVWLGTNKGISVFKGDDLVHTFSEENGLPYEEVRHLKKDKNQTIWIGTWGGGVMKFNPTNKRFEMNFRINSYMNQLLITALDVDQSNNLWVGTTDGLVYYEIDNQKVARLTQSDGLSGNEISTIFTDSKNIVWVGARGKGISRIDDDQISNIDLKRKITPTSIIEDNAGNLWIGTEGKGVLVFDGEKIIKEYRIKNGLLSDYISLLNIDDNGNVWIGSNKGLNKFDIKQQRIYSFSEKMGYVGIESKQNATYKDKDGNLWFGTIKGVVKFNSNAENNNELEALTQITTLTVNLEERAMVKDLELDYKEKSIVFNYSSICLTNPQEVYYQVMLDGLDGATWSDPTQQNFASYTPLPPGKYTFKVKASNNNGVWNIKPITYSFKIIPPIWQRAWFIVLCVVLMAFGVYGFVKYREQKLTKEKRILEDRVQERTEEVVQKSAELERKNKDIIDSITYAKRIQEAILPSDERVKKELSQSFILFTPKDIVSGDFYWLATKDDKTLFAAVDCTGHGVPGAFMSIVGHNLLDKIVGEYGITEPAKILDELNKGVAETLTQGEGTESIRDGMDIALCCLDKHAKTLDYSGAYNPLYIVSKNKFEGTNLVNTAQNKDGLKLYEVKANRFPIGNYSDETKHFTNHTIQLNKGDTIYLFSDGYADQFGGEKGKKFRYKRFKEILLEMNDLPMDQQKNTLTKEFNEWMGNYEQIDDVIIIGSRL